MQQSHDIKKITDDYRRMDLEILQVQRNVVAPGIKRLMSCIREKFFTLLPACSWIRKLSDKNTGTI